jgi:DeoR/GlpR family transcriptional regulator of sugar metabolism
MDTAQNSCASVQQEVPAAAAVASRQFFVAGEAADKVGCSASTIRRLVVELQIPVLRTAGGIRVLTGEQVEKIASELSRRRMEEDRR